MNVFQSNAGDSENPNTDKANGGPVFYPFADEKKTADGGYPFAEEPAPKQTANPFADNNDFSSYFDFPMFPDSTDFEQEDALFSEALDRLNAMEPLDPSYSSFFSDSSEKSEKTEKTEKADDSVGFSSQDYSKKPKKAEKSEKNEKTEKPFSEPKETAEASPAAQTQDKTTDPPVKSEKSEEAEAAEKTEKPRRRSAASKKNAASESGEAQQETKEIKETKDTKAEKTKKTEKPRRGAKAQKSAKEEKNAAAPKKKKLQAKDVLKVAAAALAVSGILVTVLILFDFFTAFTESAAQIQAYLQRHQQNHLYQNAVRSSSEQLAQQPAESLEDLFGLEGKAAFESGTRSTPAVYTKNTVRNENYDIYLLRKDVNADIIGRLEIPGMLTEPVVQSSAVQYYLSHKADLNYSRSGSVMADPSCSLLTPPENLLLRGMAGEEGHFYPLLRLLERNFETVQPYITIKLTTLYEEELYRLFAVLAVSSDPTSDYYFDYATHLTFKSDEEMMDYVARCLARSLYPLGVDVLPQDRLLTLATITPSTAPGGEVVLLYRMAREEEYAAWGLPVGQQ